MESENRIIRLKQVMHLTGLSRSSVYAAMQSEEAERMPASTKIGKRSVGWSEQDVKSWIAERIAASRQPRAEAATS